MTINTCNTHCPDYSYYILKNCRNKISNVSNILIEYDPSADVLSSPIDKIYTLQTAQTIHIHVQSTTPNPFTGWCSISQLLTHAIFYQQTDFQEFNLFSYNIFSAIFNERICQQFQNCLYRFHGLLLKMH